MKSTKEFVNDLMKVFEEKLHLSIYQRAFIKIELQKELEKREVDLLFDDGVGMVSDPSAIAPGQTVALENSLPPLTIEQLKKNFAAVTKPILETEISNAYLKGATATLRFFPNEEKITEFCNQHQTDYGADRSTLGCFKSCADKIKKHFELLLGGVK